MLRRVLLALPTLAMLVSGTARPAEPSRAKDVCFGGQEQVVGTSPAGPLRTQGAYHWSAPDFQVVDGELLYATDWQLRRIDLATMKETWTKLDKPIIFMGARGGQVLGVEEDHARTIGNDLLAVDLRTGEERTLLAGGSIHKTSLRHALYVPDGKDLYFIQGPYDRVSKVGDKYSKFFRLRDGVDEPELLGDEPQGVYTSFRIDHGFVYWNRLVGDESFELSRRPLSLDSPIQKLAVTKHRHIALVVAGGRVYYLDDGALWSVPVDGAKPPTRHTDKVGTSVKNLLADRSCLYWTSDRGILRMGLKGKSSPELIADDRSYHGGSIVSDGSFLYWQDTVEHRFKRLGRSAHALAPESVLVAKPVILKAPPPDTAAAGSSLAVGDGWGCARLFGWGQPHWQCWGSGTPQVRAQGVPWLSAKELANGPASLCFLDKAADACWPWPDFVKRQPQNVPQEQLSVGKDGSQLLVGGTFACTILYVGSERMLKCSGDNSFAQRAEAEQPVMLETWRGAAGTWHGCVQGHGDTYCWGRGDGGQLGREPEQTCTVAGRDVPCAKDLRKVSFPLGPVEKLVAGDMFTCALGRGTRRFVCWGASRDGWFGDTACPASLRQAWPTTSGPVPAPRATCSPSPVVLSDFNEAKGDVSVGPRGACAMVGGHVRCLGAIPTPSVDVDRFKVSPGVRASACGIAGDKVLCWGEGYSSPDSPNVPVSIAFPATQPLSAVVDFPPPTGTEWPQDRLIHRGCSTPPTPLPKCAADVKGHPWSSLLAKAPSLVGQTIIVQDRLLVGPVFRQQAGHRSIVVGEGDRALRLGLGTKMECVGDESRLCCGRPAFGQLVVAKGVLGGSNDGGWALKSEEICEVGKGGGGR